MGSIADPVMVCPAPVAQMLQQYANVACSQGRVVPEAGQILCNGWEQLKAFLDTPHAPGWAQLAAFAVYFPLQMLAAKRTIDAHELRTALNVWRTGAALPRVNHAEGGAWVYNDKAALNQDVVTYITVADAVSNRQSQVIVLARLGDGGAESTGSDYPERWRRFLACLNLFQFIENFRFWTSSETEAGLAPEIPPGSSPGQALEATMRVADEWQPVMDNAMPSLRPYLQELASAGLPIPAAIPEVEHFNEQIDDDAFAELAWPHCRPPIALLAGDQIDFAARWQQQGWRVVTPDDLQAKGIHYLIDQLFVSTEPPGSAGVPPAKSGQACPGLDPGMAALPGSSPELA